MKEHRNKGSAYEQSLRRRQGRFSSCVWDVWACLLLAGREAGNRRSLAPCPAYLHSWADSALRIWLGEISCRAHAVWDCRSGLSRLKSGNSLHAVLVAPWVHASLQDLGASLSPPDVPGSAAAPFLQLRKGVGLALGQWRVVVAWGGLLHLQAWVSDSYCTSFPITTRGGVLSPWIWMWRGSSPAEPTCRIQFSDLWRRYPDRSDLDPKSCPKAEGPDVSIFSLGWVFYDSEGTWWAGQGSTELAPPASCQLWTCRGPGTRLVARPLALTPKALVGHPWGLGLLS